MEQWESHCQPLKEKKCNHNNLIFSNYIKSLTFLTCEHWEGCSLSQLSHIEIVREYVKSTSCLNLNLNLLHKHFQTKWPPLTTAHCQTTYLYLRQGSRLFHLQVDLPTSKSFCLHDQSHFAYKVWVDLPTLKLISLHHIVITSKYLPVIVL